MSVEPILKVESIAFERNDSLLFSPVSFTLGTGEALQLEGANGSGKTTLFGLVTHMLEPSQGRIFYRGESIDKCRYDYLSNLLFVGHQSALKGVLTAAENLSWLSPATTSPEKIIDALQVMGLQGYEHIPCYQLSAGQQRRVALARLITTQATLWFLDEPFAALDKQGVDHIESLMQGHLQQGGSILFSSHQDLTKIVARKHRLLDRGAVDE